MPSPFKKLSQESLEDEPSTAHAVELAPVSLIFKEQSSTETGGHDVEREGKVNRDEGHVTNVE